MLSFYAKCSVAFDYNVTGEPESLVGTKEVQGLLDKFFCIFINSIKINGND